MGDDEHEEGEEYEEVYLFEEETPPGRPRQASETQTRSLLEV